MAISIYFLVYLTKFWEAENVLEVVRATLSPIMIESRKITFVPLEK